MSMKTREEIEAAMRKAGLPVRFCGLNADWSFEAWHLGPSAEPNVNLGDYYLLDTEDEKFAVVQTTDQHPYDAGPLNPEWWPQDIIAGATLEMVIIEAQIIRSKFTDDDDEPMSFDEEEFITRRD